MIFFMYKKTINIFQELKWNIFTW